MHTEDEARKKWCHRIVVAKRLHPDACCIASDCMAWQWGELFEAHESGVTHRGKYKQSDKGYCGLAGKGGEDG